VGSRGMPPDRDPPVHAEPVHESSRTRVTRLFLPGRTVVRKEPLGPDAERRLRNESAMLERLREVDGVAQLLEAPRYPGSVVLADAGDRHLAGLAKPLPVDELVDVALQLARAVAGMHLKGVMHRDITPANVLLAGDGALCLVDFAQATSLAEVRPAFTHHTEIVGTLAYLAPEQTGRTGRSVDQRADLYALGATLYELATGEPPFGVGDPLRLTHDHLARVPVPPAAANRAIPAPLSEIILHLLEKEPDHRYQTAEGLVHDLERVREARVRPAAAAVVIGEHDVPLRLLPPSRLVGRDDEVAALDAAFTEAHAGRCRGVLVGGAPGVGKTALVDELRPVVTGADGWFVAGKFDQYRRDLEFDAVNQAFRALGRLLLAEPDNEVAEVRARIRRSVGLNAGLLTATVPEMAALLDVPPDPGDPLTAQVRAQQMGVDLLRSVASRKRPVVLFVDDLQWAGRTTSGFIDLVLRGDQVDGLLLVGAHRDVDAAHPLTAMISRWRRSAAPTEVRLENLPASARVTMIAEMLHVGRGVAAELAEAIGPRLSGNPYETVELLNALRRDGVLTASATGWRWDVEAVRAHLGRSEVTGMSAGRVHAMPEPARRLVEAMACLGGRVERGLLQIATDEPADAIGQALEPALAEGVLVAEPGAEEAVRFRHDRIRDAVLGGLDRERLRVLQLAMARRLAGVPELFAVAAEQYLAVADAVDDPAERRMAVGLLRRAADQAALVGEYALVHALLSAALPLIGTAETATHGAVRMALHSALYSLGRLEEADEEYRTIERLCPKAVGRGDSTVLQVRSLTHRNLAREAIGLGLAALRELGVAVPAAASIPPDLDRQLQHMYHWLEHTEPVDDLHRPDLTEPALIVASRLIEAVVPATYFLPDMDLSAWLSLQALRIWLDHGPGRCSPGCYAAFAPMTAREDYAAAYHAARRILAMVEVRASEPDTSRARLTFAYLACWFEPVQELVHEVRRAREGLIAVGDLAVAGYTYYPTAYYLLVCAPSLDEFAAELEAGLAFLRRTGSEETAQLVEPYRWLSGVLRGESSVAAGDAAPTDRYADNPVALLHGHLAHALVAAVFADPAGLERHTAAAMPLLPAIQGNYPTAVARVLRGLALAGRARAADERERTALLAELAELMDWLAARAVDAPENFLHLLRLLEAEQAHAVGDFRAASLAYDAALREVGGLPRPWHRALIAEHAARFLLANGMEHAGYAQLAAARAEYARWGADAKVAQLDWAYPTLRRESDPRADPRQRLAATTGTVDLLGILSASQALSSETSIDRLHARVVEALGAMVGATGVRLLLWSDDHEDWLLPGSTGGGRPVPVTGTGLERAAPLSVLRYVQRTGEPLVIADATRDDRFARDPYFTDMDRCSQLALPVLGRGALRAVLLLENRFIRGAFTTDRLDVIQLIAAQLAVSLDNAQLYAELTASRARIVAAADAARRRLERDLHDGAQQQLVSLVLQLRAAQAAVPAAEVALARDLDEVADGLGSALDELRELARGIHPAVLAEGGLRPALRTLARRSAIPIRLDVRLEDRLPEQVEIAAYYVVAEALTNATKHARATTLDIEADTDDGILRLVVRDDGRGGADLAGGSGLVGLKDRVEALGGRLVLNSPAGGGTVLQVGLPFTARP